MATNFFGMYVHSSYFQWRAAEVLSSLFSAFGLITSIIEYETGFSVHRTHDNCKEEVNDLHRYLTLSFTMISVVLLSSRYFLKAKWYNLMIFRLFLLCNTTLIIQPDKIHCDNVEHLFIYCD